MFKYFINHIKCKGVILASQRIQSQPLFIFIWLNLLILQY